MKQKKVKLTLFSPLKLKVLGLGLGAILGVTAYAGDLFRATANIPKASVEHLIHKPLFKNWGILSEEKQRSDIRAVDAWKLEEGSRSVIVAVIDTGLDAQHPDLAANIWRDKDFSYGWDFVKNKSNPTDEHGHGTHVAGIIGAIANPKSGISGVAHKVSIMSVKYYSDQNSGSVNLANTVKAINYAIDHGARIINYSGGGPEFSESEYLALKKAESKGILVVAAAGNERQNTDFMEHYYYPAAYAPRLTNIISVAATTTKNQLLPSSNWGKNKVDVAAPGEAIYSTIPGGRYGQMSGTSQATAFVTGIAALLLSKDPSLKPQQIRTLIASTVDRLPALKGKIAAEGRVNAYQALLKLTREKTSPKAAPTRLARAPVAPPKRKLSLAPASSL